MHAAQRVHSGSFRFVEQDLAVMRMTNTEWPFHVRYERIEQHGARFGLRGTSAFVIGYMALDMVCAGFHQQLVQPKPLDFSDAPGCKPLATDTILIDDRLFEQENRLTGAAHDDR